MKILESGMVASTTQLKIIPTLGAGLSLYY